MKTEQRFTPVALACACLLTASLSPSAFAADKSAYAGAWQSPDFSLTITPQSAQFTIDGKTYTDTTPEYFYGQLATSPFLYLQDAQQEHRLYLILDEDSQHNQSLRGYHDYASVSYPLEITRDPSRIPNKTPTLSQN
ncbi:MAG: hypothetical protein BWK73_11845 [Thiothrix lacustris]|uniref:Uncharacterized protein n=1 Tax=Thiothrix lacustris TaxID=525917 RepID=A0A1Y1QTN8_9GAMM|nr:MAG: hypothetical protein BWK73_11845 [Thiothrix lacustris]